jgi:hypothetical protein
MVNYRFFLALVAFQGGQDKMPFYKPSVSRGQPESWHNISQDHMFVGLPHGSKHEIPSRRISLGSHKEPHCTISQRFNSYDLWKNLNVRRFPRRILIFKIPQTNPKRRIYRRISRSSTRSFPHICGSPHRFDYEIPGWSISLRSWHKLIPRRISLQDLSKDLACTIFKRISA